MKYCCLIFIVFLFTDCSKNAAGKQINCEALKMGLLKSDALVVNNSLGSLLSIKYTSQNFTSLADTISKSCGFTVEYACFNCVQTLPPQSEIGLVFLGNNGDSILRILDLAAAADSSIKLLGIEQ